MNDTQDQSLDKQDMFFHFAFFLFATTGQAKGSCLHPNISWVSPDILDTLHPVADPYQCQAICVDTEGCTAFTWTTQDNRLRLHCFLFASMSNQTSCDECVSGPARCTCSSEVACYSDENNILEEIHAVQTEAECQNYCLENHWCKFYTWQNSCNFPANFCVLLSSCEDTATCHGCYSGPCECSHELPTTTITTPVIEGKDRFTRVFCLPLQILSC